MREIIQDYFTFNKRERNGVFVLICIIILLLIWNFLITYYPAETPFDFTRFEQEVKRLEASPFAYTGKARMSSPKQATEEGKPEPTLFPFDPNHLSENKWKRLGLNSGQIASIHKYEAKGGRFRTKEDLHKMYVIDDALYEKLKPYISIRKEHKGVANKQTQRAAWKKPASSSLLIELNSADTAELKRLHGIGKVYAKRIVAYRKSLGGYVHTGQLKEIHGITDKLYEDIKDHLMINTGKIRRIDINTCSERELKAHPYINAHVAEAIIAYRNMHGKYQSTEGVMHSHLVNEQLYAKIAPYLRVR